LPGAVIDLHDLPVVATYHSKSVVSGNNDFGIWPYLADVPPSASPIVMLGFGRRLLPLRVVPFKGGTSTAKTTLRRRL
jgi:hypothetical protein